MEFCRKTTMIERTHTKFDWDRDFFDDSSVNKACDMVPSPLNSEHAIAMSSYGRSQPLVSTITFAWLCELMKADWNQPFNVWMMERELNRASLSSDSDHAVTLRRVSSTIVVPLNCTDKDRAFFSDNIPVVEPFESLYWVSVTFILKRQKIRTQQPNGRYIAWMSGHIPTSQQLRGTIPHEARTNGTKDDSDH